MANLNNQFLWFELLTQNSARAAKFYRNVIGWRTDVWEGGAVPYTLLIADDDVIGGIITLPKGARKQGALPHWLGYVCVTDVDASTDRAQQLGASLLFPATDIPDVGRFSVINDPQGAGIALYTPLADAPSANTAPQRGRMIWHELVTTDPDAAWNFYHELFGWNRTDAIQTEQQGTYQMFGTGGRTLGGIIAKPADMPGPPAWLYYTTVDSLDAALTRVAANGGRVLNGPMEVPGGDVVAQCMDPQNAIFALHQIRPA
ncbi:MAG: cfp30B: 27 kDa antigen Cfp30B [Gammaproteobacteria bacterium]|nr:MAG: cfp30B: 27 kDa antigen Cfp30B [Gammaproteobacteria bacterium]TND02249.1 MAG: cfp30B: 27 kDa antigen Cfp30B [Gammaproteobacteria bacterium]